MKAVRVTKKKVARQTVEEYALCLVHSLLVVDRGYIHNVSVRPVTARQPRQGGQNSSASVPRRASPACDCKSQHARSSEYIADSRYNAFLRRLREEIHLHHSSIYIHYLLYIWKYRIDPTYPV